MKFRSIFWTLIAIIFIMYACDKIDAPYVIKTGTNTDTTQTVHKTVLIEEFTGHLCPNCPRGAAAIHDIVVAHGPRVIVVAVHAAYNGRPTASFPADYRTPVGNELDNTFKMEQSGLPKGMVNRIGFPELTHKIMVDALAGKVAEALNLEALMDVKITRSYLADTRKVNIDVNATTLKQLQRKLMLSVFITESNIVSPQKNSDPLYGTTPEILNYVHNHVLRAAVNGTWGDVLCTGNQVPPGTLYTRTYQYTLNEAWNADNCAIVAFVYDGDTYEVIQAAEIKVK